MNTKSLLEVIDSFKDTFSSIQFSSVAQSCLTATPWTAAHQASLSITNFQSLLKLMSTESVMPSNNLILCCPLRLPPSIFPSIRVFTNESALHIRWPKYWSFSFSIRAERASETIELEIQGWDQHHGLTPGPRALCSLVGLPRPPCPGLFPVSVTF